jgi:hypothetical protein
MSNTITKTTLRTRQLSPDADVWWRQRRGDFLLLWLLLLEFTVELLFGLKPLELVIVEINELHGGC